MSSILKALKKLDQTTPGGGRTPSSSDTGFASAPFVHETRWPKKAFVYIGVAVVVMAVAIAAIVYWPESTDRSSSSQHPVAAVIPAQEKQAPESAWPTPATQNLSAAGTEPDELMPENPPMVRPKKSLKKATFTRKTAASINRSSRVTASTSSGSSSLATVPLLEDDTIKLQAISWAVDRESRIAVINAKVLREGDSIAGYQIAEIDENGVVVRKGGIDRRLEIRLK